MTSSSIRDAGLERSPIVVGAIVGLLAGVPTGIVLQLGTDLMSVFGGIIGSTSVVVGWAFHLATSTVFGAFFGWHVRWPVFRTLTNSVAGAIIWGIIFGVVWYAYIVIGVVIPALTSVFEFPAGAIQGPALGDPITAIAFSIAYIVYGAVLGFGYASLESEQAEPDHRGPEADQETLSE